MKEGTGEPTFHQRGQKNVHKFRMGPNAKAPGNQRTEDPRAADAYLKGNTVTPLPPVPDVGPRGVPAGVLQVAENDTPVAVRELTASDPQIKKVSEGLRGEKAGKLTTFAAGLLLASSMVGGGAFLHHENSSSDAQAFPTRTSEIGLENPNPALRTIIPASQVEDNIRANDPNLRTIIPASQVEDNINNNDPSLNIVPEHSPVAVQRPTTELQAGGNLWDFTRDDLNDIQPGLGNDDRVVNGMVRAMEYLPQNLPNKDAFDAATAPAGTKIAKLTPDEMKALIELDTIESPSADEAAAKAAWQASANRTSQDLDADEATIAAYLQGVNKSVARIDSQTGLPSDSTLIPSVGPSANGLSGIGAGISEVGGAPVTPNVSVPQPDVVDAAKTGVTIGSTLANDTQKQAARDAGIQFTGAGLSAAQQALETTPEGIRRAVINTVNRPPGIPVPPSATTSPDGIGPNAGSDFIGNPAVSPVADGSISSVGLTPNNPDVNVDTATPHSETRVVPLEAGSNVWAIVRSQLNEIDPKLAANEKVLKAFVDLTLADPGNAQYLDAFGKRTAPPGTPVTTLTEEGYKRLNELNKPTIYPTVNPEQDPAVILRRALTRFINNEGTQAERETDKEILLAYAERGAPPGAVITDSALSTARGLTTLLKDTPPSVNTAPVSEQATAEAQPIVILKRGDTIWGILENRLYDINPEIRENERIVNGFFNLALQTAKNQETLKQLEEKTGFIGAQAWRYAQPGMAIEVFTPAQELKIIALEANPNIVPGSREYVLREAFRAEEDGRATPEQTQMLLSYIAPEPATVVAPVSDGANPGLVAEPTSGTRQATETQMLSAGENIMVEEHLIQPIVLKEGQTVRGITKARLKAMHPDISDEDLEKLTTRYENFELSLPVNTQSEKQSSGWKAGDVVYILTPDAIADIEHTTDSRIDPNQLDQLSKDARDAILSADNGRLTSKQIGDYIRDHTS